MDNASDPDTQDGNVDVYTTSVGLMDFVVGEDNVMIEVTQDDDAPYRELLSSEIVSNPEGGNSTLILQYAGVDDGPILQINIGVPGVDTTLDDITFVNQEQAEGSVLDPANGPTLTGGNGNDTLDVRDIDIGSEILELVNMGSGDDFASVSLDVSVGVQVNDESGNDTLTSSGQITTLDGGEGDDVLDGRGGDTLLGAAGDDTSSTNLSQFFGLAVHLDGGSGDDEIKVRTSTGNSLNEPFFQPGVEVIGSDGADIVTVFMGDPTIDFGNAGIPAGSDTQTSSGIVLEDLDPAEDSLIIQTSAGGPYDLTTVAIEAGTYVDQGETLPANFIVLTFASALPDLPGVRTVTIRLGDGVDIAVSDIALVQS